MAIHTIYKSYKTIFFSMILLIILLTTGCAGGGTEVTNPTASADDGTSSDAPVLSISNLAYFPASANVEFGGGEITVNGSLDFVDDDGNVSNLIIDIIDSDNYQVEQITESIEEFSGQTSGTIEFTLPIDIEFQDDYTFEIYIMDESDNESNVLKGTVSVTN